MRMAHRRIEITAPGEAQVEETTQNPAEAEVETPAVAIMHTRVEEAVVSVHGEPV